MTLYEIDQELLQCMDTETGEILDYDRLTELQMARDEKIEKVALWYKNLLADAEAYKNEKNAFYEREKQAKEKAASLKEWLNNALAGTPFKSTRVAVSFRKVEKVAISNLLDLPHDFVKFAEPQPDKIAIKKAIKEGMEVSGAYLEQDISMSIR